MTLRALVVDHGREIDAGCGRARTTGSAVVHMSSLGSSDRATPSTTTMVFCSSSSSGRVRRSGRAS